MGQHTWKWIHSHHCISTVNPSLSILFDFKKFKVVKSRLFILNILCIFSLSLNAQFKQANGGGEFIPDKGECITHDERAMVNEIIEYNIKKYNLERQVDKSMMVLYDWPVAQNPVFDYNSTWAISNYVDHDPAFPNMLEDYNCGTHTYDTGSGYNHQGIDIYLWPFDHNQVDADQTWAVAGADGMILAKNDGEVDNNCSFNSNPANWVILEHSDGSRSWYWHLKNGSVTTKAVGASVVAGEYLGVIASSGNSTGPHLHFECYDDNLQLIDPYAGSCNSWNASSYWNNQKAYWEADINVLLTHPTPPSFQACPNPDITNLQTMFMQGDLVYFAAYYHDQQTTSVSNYTIRRPDGSTWYNWNHSPPGNYRSSWWYWFYNLPSNAMVGTWEWEATLNGVTYTHEFEVYTCPDSYSAADGNALTGSQTTSEDYETDGVIESTQVISGVGTAVDYDSGSEIILNPGFHAILGAVFHAFIDGCGGSMAKEEKHESNDK